MSTMTMTPVMAVAFAILPACAGASDGTFTAVEDSCAIARPSFSVATDADRSLFAYNVNAPLNLQKTVESTSNGVEVSRIHVSSVTSGMSDCRNKVACSGLSPNASKSIAASSVYYSSSAASRTVVSACRSAMK